MMSCYHHGGRGGVFYPAMRYSFFILFFHITKERQVLVSSSTYHHHQQYQYWKILHRSKWREECIAKRISKLRKTNRSVDVIIIFDQMFRLAYEGTSVTWYIPNQLKKLKIMIHVRYNKKKQPEAYVTSWLHVILTNTV